jgi:hypothetical protein
VTKFLFHQTKHPLMPFATQYLVRQFHSFACAMICPFSLRLKRELDHGIALLFSKLGVLCTLEM